MTGEEAPRSSDPGILVLGVDILPSELPREASEHFSKLLTPMIEALAKDSMDDKMKAVLDGACIARDGVLQPEYA